MLVDQVIYFLLICMFFKEKRIGEIVLKAMGQAISKAVAIAEILKVIYIYIYFSFCY